LWRFKGIALASSAQLSSGEGLKMDGITLVEVLPEPGKKSLKVRRPLSGP
jgi:hypothetical protein